MLTPLSKTSYSVQSNTVFNALNGNLSQVAVKRLKADGYPLSHHAKWNWIKRSGKNIITGYFNAQGVSLSVFEKEVENLTYYLSIYFSGSQVLLEDNPEAKVITIKKSSSTVKLYLNYRNRISAETEQNEGQRYQQELIDTLRTSGYTSQTKAEEIDSDQDVTINSKNRKIGIEIKSNWRAAFGQATLYFGGNSWHVKQNSDPVIRQLITQHNLIQWINKKWYEETGNYIPNTNPTKQDQQMLGGGTGHYIDISPEFVKKYYDKSDYIHIKGKGFYKNGTKNPLNISANKVSNFNPSSAKARIRVKYIGNGKYGYRIEMYLGELQSSVNIQGLDGDLSFLGEP
jgi:hypothetical protein